MIENRDEILELIGLALDARFGLSDGKLADKWRGGDLVIHPGDPSLQAKKVPIDTLFHKIVMLRESLRVLEQKINNHPKLDDTDRVQLQQYISRVYGTLTTFNVLFKDERDKFVGQAS